MQAQSKSADIIARLERIPANGYLWKLIAAISVGGWFEYYDVIFTGAIAPGLAKSGLLSTTTKTFFGYQGVAGFIAATFFGLFAGTFFLGHLSDRFGRRRTYTVALLAYSAASAIMAFQNTAEGLLFWRFLAGVGIGIQIVTINTFIVELVPAHMRGKALGLNQAMMFTAMPVSALIAAYLVPLAPLGLDGWRWIVLIGCVGAFLVIFLLRVLPETPRWLAEHGHEAEAETVMARIEAEAVRRTGKELPAPVPVELPKKEAKASFAEIFRPPYRSRVIMLIVFNFFQAIGYYGFSNWIPTLLIAKNIVVTKSLIYTSIMALANPAGPLLSMAFSDRVERKWLIVGTAVCIAGFGSLFANATEVLPLILLGIMLTLSNSIMSVSFHTYQTEVFPTRVRTRASGLVYSFSRLGAVASGFAIAWMLQTGGVPYVFAMISCAMLIVMLSIGIFGPKTMGKKLEEI